MKTQLTIQDFKKLTDIVQDDSLLPVEKEIATIKIFDPGLTDEEVAKMDMGTFTGLLAATDLPKNQAIIKSFTHNGIKYELEGDQKDFEFSVHQMLAIQKAMAKDNTNYIHKMMAVVYTSDVDNDRAQIFYENMPMIYAVPFLNIITTIYAGKVDFRELG